MNRGFGARFFALVEEMAPANFAMVMSTGIISVALRILGCRWGSVLLYGVNLGMYALLWVLLLLRLVRSPGRVVRDFTSHARGPGFLTIVAGTCILGTQSAVLVENFAAAAWLFWFGAACWAFILWGVFLAIFTGSNKPSLAGGINGAWLVATVSTQSLVILGATLAAPLGWDAELSWFCLCALFMLGIVLYIFVITGIFTASALRTWRPESWTRPTGSTRARPPSPPLPGPRSCSRPGPRPCSGACCPTSRA